ncbi:MAG: transcriptional repressor [Thermoleophilaceae bacterium]|nr:transcriptional repressor [Thermoleophilaceae bacterium]
MVRVSTSSRDDLAESLRERGLRVTPQRRAILAAFSAGENGHVTADDVFERAVAGLPELSRATVYNTLGELVRVGLLQRVDGAGPTLYDPNLDRTHHHFRCLRCGSLSDIHLEGEEDVQLAESGYVVERTRVTLEGLCPTCATTGDRRR